MPGTCRAWTRATGPTVGQGGTWARAGGGGLLKGNPARTDSAGYMTVAPCRRTPPSASVRTYLSTFSRNGGWKVAQVIILLGRISPMFPEAASCDVEVGVPVVSWQGRITNSKAQLIASLAADDAAQRVFAERLPTALMCQSFRVKMGAFMTDSKQVQFISGAKVSGFNPWNIEITPRTFP
jgi:hypothetical protein